MVGIGCSFIIVIKKKKKTNQPLWLASIVGTAAVSYTLLSPPMLLMLSDFYNKFFAT